MVAEQGGRGFCFVVVIIEDDVVDVDGERGVEVGFDLLG